MSEFTQKEIEGILSAMRQREEPSTKIPLRPPIVKVELAELKEELKGEKGSFEDLNVKIEVLYGTKTMTLKELSELQVGGLLSLDEEEAEQYEVLANGKKMALGELVSTNGEFGIRITKILI